MTYRVFRIAGDDKHIRWGATSEVTDLRHIIQPHMARVSSNKPGSYEWCFYGKTPFEALERLKACQRKLKAAP